MCTHTKSANCMHMAATRLAQLLHAHNKRSPNLAQRAQARLPPCLVVGLPVRLQPFIFYNSSLASNRNQAVSPTIHMSISHYVTAYSSHGTME